MSNEQKKIFERISLNPDGITITTLAAELGMSRQTVSKYVLVLEALEKITIVSIGPAKLLRRA